MSRWFMQGDKEGSSTPYGDNPSCGKYVDVDDDGECTTKLYYEVYGSKTGDPLFVLHGGGVGCSYELGLIVDRLLALGKHKIVLVTTRGHGRSGLGKCKMSMEQRVKDLSAVVHQEVSSGTRISLIGFSDGGYTALALAKHRPELVERVITIGVGSVKPGDHSADADVQQWIKCDPVFTEYMKKVMPEFGRWQEFASDYMSFWNKVSLGRGFFGSVSCPVLLIAGDEDDHVPIQTVVDAYMMLPQARLAIIPKARHTCFLDNLDATWDAIKPFIAEPIDSLKPSVKKNVTPIPDKPVTTEMLRSCSSWDGAKLPKYPEGQPEIVVNNVSIPPHSRLPWHSHGIMSYALVQRGDLTIIKRETGEERTFHTGDVFPEVVGSIHCGENRGEEPVELTVFYASTPGANLSVSASQ